jgi:hypothetical protein
MVVPCIAAEFLEAAACVAGWWCWSKLVQVFDFCDAGDVFGTDGFSQSPGVLNPWNPNFCVLLLVKPKNSQVVVGLFCGTKTWLMPHHRSQLGNQFWLAWPDDGLPMLRGKKHGAKLAGQQSGRAESDNLWPLWHFPKTECCPFIRTWYIPDGLIHLRVKISCTQCFCQCDKVSVLLSKTHMPQYSAPESSRTGSIWWFYRVCDLWRACHRRWRDSFDWKSQVFGGKTHWMNVKPRRIKGLKCLNNTNGLFSAQT